METYSRDKLPLFEYIGNKVRVNFDETIVQNTPEDSEPYESYKYITACFSKTASRAERIEAIIQTKYHSYGAELAAINGTAEEKLEHDAFVTQAKAITQQSFGA